MELVFWIIIFLVSLVAMVKGADWMLAAAEKIGLALGLSSFIVGVVIVGLGTSFPEVISSFAAILQGAPEIVAANVIGSNIANILLVVGLSAVVGGRLAVTKNLIDLDLPLLAISSALFLEIVWDKQIVFAESVLLLVMFVIYLAYTIIHRDTAGEEVDGDEYEKEPEEHTPTRAERRGLGEVKERPKVSMRDIVLLVIGLAGLVVGANYLIESVITLSEILNIAPGAISLAAVALGTSLPELLVSVRAAWQKKPEVALGNIFGSNVFNILLVAGLPGLFATLPVDEQTFTLGMPIMLIATVLFILSGISRRIHVYEGAMYVVIYVFFVGRLFGLF
jgi:cation:H+ antiporter